MPFAVNLTCQKVLQLSKKNQSLEKNSSVFSKTLEMATVARLGKCIAPHSIIGFFFSNYYSSYRMMKRAKI